jgi:prepilin-type N-terminal cleavage/methylation domain-containing protein
MRRSQHQSGFTLVEIAIVMVIIGAILTAIISSYIYARQILLINTTEERMELVQDALSAFASRNFRIPCPADPAGGGGDLLGAERGSGANGAAIGACAGNNVQGIVPYATIGLAEEDVRDGWGNFFTYQVSPAFVIDPEDNTTEIHAACRTRDWIEGVVLRENAGDRWFAGGRNINDLKARFCCSGADFNDTQICITADAGCGVTSPINPRDTNAPTDWYETANNLADHWDDHNSDSDGVDPITFPGAAPPVDAQATYDWRVNQFYIETPVYALISHGQNGLNNMGTYEGFNADPARQQVWAFPRNENAGNVYFDDIVKWQTQSQMLARLGRESCSGP